jgi:hypothetical protein
MPPNLIEGSDKGRVKASARVPGYSGGIQDRGRSGTSVGTAGKLPEMSSLTLYDLTQQHQIQVGDDGHPRGKGSR